MSALDPRTPVIVGCGQVTQRVDQIEEASEAIELMSAAAEQAAADAGAPELLAMADSIRVPQGLWKYENPAAFLAERFGAQNPETATSAIAGTSVQSMLNDAAVGIAEGRRDVVLIVGGETEHTKRRAKRSGSEFGWTPIQAGTPDRTFGAGGDRNWRDNPDVEAGITSPALTFALFECAIRHHRGESVDAHRQRISELWAGLARVAAANPGAWNQDGLDAETIAAPVGGNRMVASPYTKYHVSNMVVDQAAALILTSVETAQRLGIAEEKWIYPLAGTDAVVVRHVSEREELYEEPAMRVAGERVYELAGITPDDLAHVDLYSCFPSAVQLGAQALGLSEDRPLSVTGGLTFHGGPFNNYVIHSIATMAERLRETPGSSGLVSSVGGFFSKHAFGVYASRPPERPFQFEDVADRVAGLPGRSCDREYLGDATVESYSVSHDRSGPTHGIVACRTPDDARTWARTSDPDAMARLLAEELVGEPARIEADRAFSFR
jgi:acetyl-CoA C-acetyltransferase